MTTPVSLSGRVDWVKYLSALLCGYNLIGAQLRTWGGGKGAMAAPVPVKTSHKKDCRHLRRLIFHVSCPTDNPGSVAGASQARPKAQSRVNYNGYIFTLRPSNNLKLPTCSVSYTSWLKVEGLKKVYHSYINFIAHLWQLEFPCYICYIDSMVKNILL